MTQSQFTEITKWQDETFPEATAISKLMHLNKELDEIRSDLRKGNTTDIALEYADCLFLIFGSAAKAGLSWIDLMNAIDEKFEVNKNREWNKPDNEGVYLNKK